MFIELNSWHTGLKTLINLNLITDIDSDKNGRVVITFAENNFIYIEDSYDEIKNILSREGVLV
ncbi:hypothetical protein [Oceanobacillus timonensis]|uniref:hypothetical protein n=1 Tax=Oceanobacillus timonensis TaxID=1926285 RepID=UPI0009BB4010|nr:hypothetical protein [Oceanobacillus timonensis]